jgi:acetyltransferase-like isoleucine patch superfamily enzyme
VNAGCLFEGHRNIVIDRDCFPGPEVMIVASVHVFDPPERSGP